MRFKRIALLGIDGLSWEVLLKYVDELPAMKRVIAKAWNFVLDCVPPLTPASWTSIFTGVSPEKHGILSFIELRRGAASHVNAFSTPFPRISELLAMNDYQCLVVNAPFSYPPAAWYLRNHVLVFDAFSPKEFIYPSSFSSYLRFFRRLRHRYSTVYEMISDAIRSARLRTEGVLKLLEAVNPDFMLVVYNETDSVMHRAYHVPAGRRDRYFLEILSAIDDLVSYVERRFDVLAMVSDHGFRLFNRGVNICYLIKSLDGLLRSCSVRDKVRALIVGSPVVGYLRYSLRTLRINRRISGGPRSRGSEVYRIGAFIVDPHDVNDACFLAIEENKEHVLNLLKNAIEEKFSKYIEGIEIIRRNGYVYLIIVPKPEFFLLLESKFYSCINRDVIYVPSAQHSRLGLFSVYIKGLSTTCRKPLYARNYDVTPTLLALAGVPLPSYADGKPLILGSFEQPNYVDYYLQRWSLARRARSAIRCRSSQSYREDRRFT